MRGTNPTTATPLARRGLRVWPLLALLALVLALPAGTEAKGGGSLANKLAAKSCAQEKKATGNRAFGKRYGHGRGAMPACVKKTRAEARRAVRTATEDCQAELDEFGADEFLQDWDSFDECIADMAELELDDGPSDDGPDDDSDDDSDDEVEL